MGGCCLCACVFKLVLGILNLCVLIVGLLVAGVGGTLLGLAGSKGFHDVIRVIVLPILDNIGLFPPSSGLSPVKDEFVDYLRPSGIALLVVGLFIVCIAFLGYCGTSSDISLLLILYTIILLVILVIQTVAVAMFFTKALDPHIRKGLNLTLHDHYEDLDSGGIYSLSWNLVMVRFNCCGLDGIDDFRYGMKHGNWPKNQTLYLDNQKQTVLAETPVACCITTGEFPMVEVVSEDCSTDPKNSTNNMDKGCWDEITDLLSPFRPAALAVIIIALLVQAAVVLMSIVIIREQRSEKLTPI